MLKKLLFSLLTGVSVLAHADLVDSDPSTQVSQDPSQAIVTTTESTTPQSVKSKGLTVKKGNTIENNPTVSSLMYSGSQFPEQNALTGKANESYYTSQERKQKINNPNVNSRLYSGSQFPQQNAITGQKNEKYYTSQERKQHKNNPFVNSRLYSGAQFPQQNAIGNKSQRPVTASASM